MIAHVAEAFENSGRVVLQVAAQCELSPIALDAALHVARSFNAGLESLVSEDPGLVDFARFDFAREIAGETGSSRAITADQIEAELHKRALSHHGAIAAAAQAANVPVHCRTLPGDAVSAIAEVCSQIGPWNVAVLAQAVNDETQDHVAGLFEAIQDVTGIVVAGKAASRSRGAVVAIVEQLTQVQPMLRAAQHLARLGNEDLHLVLVGGNGDEAAWMEGQVRLLLGMDVAPDLILAPDIHASPEALVAFISCLEPGFVIAQLNGSSLPAGCGLADFVRHHEGPVFLVR